LLACCFSLWIAARSDSASRFAAAEFYGETDLLEADVARVCRVAREAAGRAQTNQESALRTRNQAGHWIRRVDAATARAAYAERCSDELSRAQAETHRAQVELADLNATLRHTIFELEKTLEFPWQVTEMAVVGNQPCW